jgi:uncharacterized membrane protein
LISLFFESQHNIIAMLKYIFAKIRPFLKPLIVFGLIATLVFSNAQTALAASSGGRIGGGSFRSSPSRSYSAPGGSYRSPGGYGYGGGGIGFPFLLPFFGFGGFGSLFTIIIFIALVNFLVRTFRNLSSGENESIEGYSNNSKVSVAQIQVGLLAQGRYLQPELNSLAQKADTGTAAGRALVLQEATLALLRHPEFWVYGSTESLQASVDQAEAKFNQLALGERSKFTAETLSNVNSQLRQATKDGSGAIIPVDGSVANEYIIVTLVVGAEGKLKLPVINGSDDLKQALQEIGSIGSDRLLAIEILWTPQAEGDTLTTDDILAQYPNLKLV